MGGADPTPQIIENVFLGMALQSYVSANSDCLAFSINEALWNISSSGNVEIKDLNISQIADARATCASEQELPASNQGAMQSAFESLAKTAVVTANSPLDSSETGKETATTINSMSKIFTATSIQDCVSGAINRAAIRDINTPNSVFVSGSVLQNATADMQTCINIQDIPGMEGTSAQDVAKQFAQSAKNQLSQETATGRRINCSVYAYWTNTAVMVYVIAIVLLILRIVLFKLFRV